MSSNSNQDIVTKLQEILQNHELQCSATKQDLINSLVSYEEQYIQQRNNDHHQESDSSMVTRQNQKSDSIFCTRETFPGSHDLSVSKDRILSVADPPFKPSIREHGTTRTSLFRQYNFSSNTDRVDPINNVEVSVESFISCRSSTSVTNTNRVSSISNVEYSSKSSISHRSPTSVTNIKRVVNNIYDRSFTSATSVKHTVNGVNDRSLPKHDVSLFWVRVFFIIYYIGFFMYDLYHTYIDRNGNNSSGQFNKSNSTNKLNSCMWFNGSTLCPVAAQLSVAYYIATVSFVITNLIIFEFPKLCMWIQHGIKWLSLFGDSVIRTIAKRAMKPMYYLPGFVLLIHELKAMFSAYTVTQRLAKQINIMKRLSVMVIFCVALFIFIQLYECHNCDIRILNTFGLFLHIMIFIKFLFQRDDKIEMVSSIHLNYFLNTLIFYCLLFLKAAEFGLHHYIQLLFGIDVFW